MVRAAAADTTLPGPLRPGSANLALDTVLVNGHGSFRDRFIQIQRLVPFPREPWSMFRDRVHSRMEQVDAGLALVRAGVMDLVRRPTTWVSTVCLGGFLGVIPHVGNPAAGVRDNAALAVELTVASWMTVIPFVSGALAMRGMDSNAGHGLPEELLAAPASDAAVVLGRWGTAVLVAGCVGAFALGLAAVGWWGAPHPVLSAAAAPWVGLAAGAVLGTAVAAAMGLVYGALVSRPLALVLLALHLLVVRALPGWGGDALWVHVLPDPSRIDVARELAFGRPVDLRWALWGALTLTLQIVALCAVATRRIARSVVRNRPK